MVQISFLLFPILLLLVQTQGSRILAFLPLDNWSHYMQYELLFETLAARGHHITMYSPFPPKQNLTNFKHVYVRNPAFNNREYSPFEDCRQIGWFHLSAYDSLEFTLKVNREILADPIFQILIRSKDAFDLAMVESTFHQQTTVLLGHYFKCPVILMGSVSVDSNILESMGSPNVLSIMPEQLRPLSDRMTLTERIQNVYYAWVRLIFGRIEYHILDNQVASFVGPGIPPLESLFRNVSFAFLYSNAALNYPFPNTPNIEHVGGIHIERYKNTTLPEDLKQILDDAHEGFIWFSLGSVMEPKTIDPVLLADLFRAFSKYKYKVVWKWSGQDLGNVPRNVILKPWEPQIPVLAHPNCKLFITHGGLNSQLEAIHFGIPVITIPYFADQYRNALLAERFGFGVTLRNTNLSEASLDWAISTVTTDSRYKEQAMARSRILKDRLRSPLDTAVYWTEYVLQHEGALHLSPVSRHLYWFQYYLLDVLAFILVIGAILGVVVLLCSKLTIKMLSKTHNAWTNENRDVKKDL